MKWLLIALFLTVNSSANQQTVQVVYTVDLPILTVEQQIYNTYLQVAECLKEDGRISMSIEDFAEACTIICWCESGFNSTADRQGQQGINQLTRSTRKLLGIPKDITSHTIEDQIWYHYIFFKACGQKRLYDIKNVEQLHFLNFKPSSNKPIRTIRSTKGLDINKDGWIDVRDIKRFEIKQLKYKTDKP